MEGGNVQAERTRGRKRERETVKREFLFPRIQLSLRRCEWLFVSKCRCCNELVDSFRPYVSWARLQSPPRISGYRKCTGGWRVVSLSVFSTLTSSQFVPHGVGPFPHLSPQLTIQLDFTQSISLRLRCLSLALSPHLFSVWPSLFVLLFTVYPLSVPIFFSLCVRVSLHFRSPRLFNASSPLLKTHLVLLFISLPINLMFPSSLLFSSHVFNLSLSLSSSITHPHSYPAVSV